MNRLKVIICGKEYILQTNEEPTYIYNLARALEKKINTLVDNNNVTAYNAAVMVAMGLLDDLKRLDKEHMKLQQSSEDIEKIREERNSALKEVARLQAKVIQLEDTQRLKDLGGVIPEYYVNDSNKDEHSGKNSKNGKKSK